MVLLLVSPNLLSFTLKEVVGVRFGGFLGYAFFSSLFSFCFGATFFFSLAVALDGLFAIVIESVTRSALLSLSPSNRFIVFRTKSGSLAAAPTQFLILEDLL